MKNRNYFTTLFVILVICLSLPVEGKTAAVIDGLTNPRYLAAANDRLYIEQNTVIYIYSLTDFKLIKKFGHDGTEPVQQLGALPISIDVRFKDMIINSGARVSFFSRDGMLKKVLQVIDVGSTFYQPLGDGFAAQGIAFKGDDVCVAVHLFDARLNKVKQVFLYEDPVVKDRKIDLLHQDALFSTCGDKLYVGSREDLTIDVFDHTGKQINTIKHPKQYQKRKFTAKDEKNIRELLKSMAPGEYEQAKDRLFFNDHYSAIADLVVTGNAIFVLTWKRKPGQAEFIIFDINGKLKKQGYFPFVPRDPIAGYPWNIDNGKLYQVIQNSDTQKWELHVNDFGLYAPGGQDPF
jgi:hypothetical protein